MLPNDPVMLLSVINMKLRDACVSLDALCDDLDVSRSELCETLSQIGYEYDAGRNQFV